MVFLIIIDALFRVRAQFVRSFFSNFATLEIYQNMSDSIPPPPPPDDEIPPPPPPPEEAEEDEEEELLGAEIDFEKLAARAAKIAARANQRQQTLPPSSDETKKKNKRKRENAEGATTTTTTIATMPAPPVKTVLDEVDEKRMEDGDRVWGIALSSCSEYPNKKYFFR